MTYTEKRGVKSAKKIVSTLTDQDEVDNIKETLTKLFYEWVQSEQEYSQKQRSLMLFHYISLQNLLSDIEAYQEERGEVG